MKRPQKLKIGGFVWTITYNHDVNHESQSWGSCHFQTQKIFIEEGLSSQKEEEVLLHEILHVVLNHCGQSKMFSGEDEERLVSAIAPTLHQVLKDNKLEFGNGH